MAGGWNKGSLKVPSNTNCSVILQTHIVKRNGLVKSNAPLKRSQPALITAWIVKISCFGWNVMKQHSWAVSITVYEFQVVLNTHAVNNILLGYGMLLNCFQRPPFSLHLTGLETLTETIHNHMSKFTLKNRNQKMFSKFFGRSQCEWAKCHEREVACVGSVVGVCAVNLVESAKV